MQRIFFWLMSIMLICLLITGCRSTPSAADPTPVRAMTPVPTFTTTPESTPTLTQISPPLSPTPVPTPQPVITLTPLNETVRLPATLYFLSMEGQLWSLGGQTNQYRQLTNEALPIIDFDIALTHGRLVYVTNNQLIEFDPATNQRIVKLASLPEADLWALNETGYRYCAQCSTDQILSPRYSPDGAQIAYAQGGINVIASGADTSAPPQQAQVNIRFQIDTQNVNATRFYDDSHWSPDGTRLTFHTLAWEWAGYEIYDFAQSSLQIVRSPTVPGVHLCCEWQWGSDSQTGYITAVHGVIEDSGVYRVDGTTATVTQLNTEKSSQWPRLQRVARAAHQTVSGELYAFIGVNDALLPWQPDLYTMHRIDPNGGAPIPLNKFQIPIEGEVLWAPDGSGAVVMTASFTQPGELPRGKFVWLDTQGEYGNIDSLYVRGSHLRWGAN